jgi:hypothetical protein
MIRHSIAFCLSLVSIVTFGSDMPQLSEGQYYNNEQIWQAQEDGIEQPKPVELSVTQREPNAYDLLVSSGDDVGQYTLEILTPASARLYADRGTCSLVISQAPLDTADWQAEFDPTACGWPVAHAEVRTRWLIGQGIFLSGESSHVTLATDYFGRSQGIALRRAFQYSGWFVIDPRQSKESTTTEDAQFVRGLKLHSEGAKQELIRPDGISTGIEIELAALTHQGTRAQILKLALYRVGEDRAFTYIWSENGADRLGINLRWLQVGLTRDN